MKKNSCLLALLLVFLLMLTASAEELWIVDDEEPDLPNWNYQARFIMRNMTLDEKIYQLFLVDPEALTGENRVLNWQFDQLFVNAPVGGVIFFGRNVQNETQFAALTAALQAAAQSNKLFPPFLAVMEEGGTSSPIANRLGYTLLPAASELSTVEDAFSTGLRLAEYLVPLGINLDIAPVIDVLIDRSATLWDRSFGLDPIQVTNLSSAFAAGMRQGGLIPCFCHFPGEGNITGDLNTGKSTTRRTLNEMRTNELLPFYRAVTEEAEIIQVSHETVSALDSVPASLSSAVVTQLLRNEMGYQGVVMTDSLRMGAITTSYQPGDAAIRALQAGADLLLLPADLSAAVSGIKKALQQGTLTEERIDESVERIIALKIRCGIITTY